MGMSTGGGQAVQATPNVTPMIDVMLVLLIIFMVVVPQMLAGFNADPPVGVNIRDHPPDEADRDLDYEKVLDAMELASKNKVRTIALVADQKAGTTSSIPGDVAAQAPAAGKAPGGN
jgi:biopolymer transport protein ExbD